VPILFIALSMTVFWRGIAVSEVASFVPIIFS